MCMYAPCLHGVRIILFVLNVCDSKYCYSFFTDTTCARFDRLKAVYSDPMTEVYLLFYLAALQLFTNFNKFLQREDPIIPVISDQQTSFLRKLLGKFVPVGAIKSAKDITSVNYCKENQLRGKTSIFVVVYGVTHALILL